MHKKWLLHSLSQLEAPVEESKEEVVGYLVGIKGRKEWRFTADPNATIEKLCECLKTQTKLASMEMPKDVWKSRILEIKDEVSILLEDKQLFYIEIESINMQPLAEKEEPGEAEKKEMLSLQRIGIKKRICHMCKVGIGAYKKKKDILICTKEKIFCVQCYNDFHWSKKGKKKYEGFTYDAKEK